MRKIILILCLSFSVPCLAQEYKPLLDNYNEWQLTSCYFGCITDVYYTDGDTIVDGNSYKILDGFHYISRTFLLREDIAQRKVYLNLVQSGSSDEYLLYDFSLNVGDSIDIKNPISPFPWDGGFYKIDSIINRPLVDGNDYRHFYLSPTPSNTISTTPAVWVEGAGSLSLINAPGGYPDINAAGHLSCFFKNGELFYSNLEAIDSCEPTILSINDENNLLDQVIISTLIEKGSAEMLHTEDIQFINIFDLNGRKLDTINNNGQQQLTLNFSGYTPAMYLVVAYTESLQKKTFKVIVK